MGKNNKKEKNNLPPPASPFSPFSGAGREGPKVRGQRLGVRAEVSWAGVQG